MFIKSVRVENFEVFASNEIFHRVFETNVNEVIIFFQNSGVIELLIDQHVLIALELLAGIFV